MADKNIRYKSGYNYQLAKDYHFKTSIIPEQAVNNKFISLDLEGNLIVKNGYAWDGVSGPVKDTKKNLRASLVHDALYQLMRKEKISAEKYKDEADKIFRKICEKDGVPSALAKIYYNVLKKVGKYATEPKNAKKIKKAPGA